MAAKGAWWAQIGVYASHDNADKLARKLRAAGFAVDMGKHAGAKEKYHVWAGPVPDKAQAQSLQAKLAAAGYQTVLVRY